MAAVGDNGDGAGEVALDLPVSPLPAQSRPQRAVSLRQRKKIQELLRPRTAKD